EAEFALVGLVLLLQEAEGGKDQVLGLLPHDKVQQHRHAGQQETAEQERVDEGHGPIVHRRPAGANAAGTPQTEGVVIPATWLFLAGGLVALLAVAGVLWDLLSGTAETPQHPHQDTTR